MFKYHFADTIDDSWDFIAAHGLVHKHYSQIPYDNGFLICWTEDCEDCADA